MIVIDIGHVNFVSSSNEFDVDSIPVRITTYQNFTGCHFLSCRMRHEENLMNMDFCRKN